MFSANDFLHYFENNCVYMLPTIIPLNALIVIGTSDIYGSNYTMYRYV